MRYDAIVVGAGSAGSVIAARLSEDPARRVLLLEAGPDYADLDSTPPDLLEGRWNSTRPHDWRFRAHHSQSGRPHPMPRGRVVGGSSAVNTTIALRGLPEDYDEWAALGNPEWSWQKVLPWFRAIEHDVDFADDFHGQSGPIPVRRYSYERGELVNWQRAFVDACRSLGLPLAADNNDPSASGCGPHPMNREGTLRISTAIAYLAPARGRPNLTMRGDTHVRRVLLNGERTVGVEIETDGAPESIFADLTVLCAGALQSPAILIRSGIGGHEALARLGLPVAAELPGVGEHLCDHPVAGVVYEPVPGACRTDVPSVQVTYRYTAPGSDRRNDMQVMPVSFYQSADGPVFSIGAVVEQVNGYGRLVIESLNPRMQPRIESHFLEDEEDLRRMVDGMRLALRLGETEPLRALHTGVRRPRPHYLASDEALAAWVRRVADSGFHPCGTAKMGPTSDPLAVVDQYGRVHGVAGLVVADASIMPTVPRANTNLTSIMIGERIGSWLADGAASVGAYGMRPSRPQARDTGSANGLDSGGAGSEDRVAAAAAAEGARRAPLQAISPPHAVRSPFAIARDRGADYLEFRQRADGLVGDESAGLGGFYKATYALAAAGRSRAAGRMVHWLREHAATPEGDFAGAWHRGGLADVYPYGNAWIAAGLLRAGAFDLCGRALDFLATLQDPRSGGLRTRVDREGPEVRQEVMSSAMAGIAALIGGRLEIADGVARFLRTILAAQPRPAEMLCHVYTPADGVITQFPEQRAGEFAVIASLPRQAYFMYGIGAAFMTGYAFARDDHAALEDAAAFLLPAHHATAAMYETAQVGKVAWGAALLAGASGDALQRDLALRAAGALLAQQNPDGSWDNTGGYTTEAQRDEVTAEFVAIMDWVEQGLAGVSLDGFRPPSPAALLTQALAGVRR
ncbi:MAG TPA: GMC family oxidoreductase N-terminal domain-containing protein [Dehalococcoidia bacterium]|nr:GMC family oxidoreductase N-terminal domain-containing protein [Dehalococcoidia bacterium]